MTTMTNNTRKTVCILTSGQGTRMGPYAEFINKALLPLGQKAIISHIIKNFPTDSEFVIALGYLGSQVRNYLEIAHPKTRLTFVDVDHFQGPGSGPGYSLYCCREYLEKPFYFVSCDTLWRNQIDFSLDSDWFGVAQVPVDETSNYCNLKIEGERVTGISDKERLDSPSYRAFVGLCFIKNHSVFWRGLSDKTVIKGEHQVSSGLRALITEEGVVAQNVDWADVGTYEKYRSVVSQYETFDFSKTNEVFYALDGKVIKFFSDPEITAKRVNRASLNPKVFPKMLDHKDQFMSYEFAPGRTLYEHNTPRIFGKFLNWANNNLWLQPAVVPPSMLDLCRAFYQKKTDQRLNQYYQKIGLKDAPSLINGVQVPTTHELLSMIPWESLWKGVPRFFHGDLQFDNILYDAAQDSFTLLDWRQDFGGSGEYGDLYYDLAKLYGGILLNYDYVKKNLLYYDEFEGEIFFDFAQRFAASEYVRVLERFIVAEGYELPKVRFLVGLIYLNMSPLHHSPFDKMLYSLGRWFLSRELSQ